MAQTTHDWIGASLASDRYLVRSKLGEGGMGYVFRAHDRNLDAEVVVKVPRRRMLEEPEFADRFTREVQSLVKLAHPHVVRVMDVGEHDGVPFAVMPYLSGGSLGGSLEIARDDEGIVKLVSELAGWLPGVAQALDFVHSRGYVHRDVKPGNILFDEHGHVLLSDFGVAKVLADRPVGMAVTGTGLVLGTPEYMAPETVMGRPYDGRIDQYALAVTVYEILSGRRPLEGMTASAVFVLQTTTVPEALAMVDPRVPAGVSDAVARALAKEPGARFATCGEFAKAIVGASATMEGSGGRTASGRFVRPDQVGLPCPACGRSLILSKGLVSDPERSKQKRLICPTCHAALRLSDRGTRLIQSGNMETTPGRPGMRDTVPWIGDVGHLSPEGTDDPADVRSKEAKAEVAPKRKMATAWLVGGVAATWLVGMIAVAAMLWRQWPATEGTGLAREEQGQTLVLKAPPVELVRVVEKETFTKAPVLEKSGEPKTIEPTPPSPSEVAMVTTPTIPASPTIAKPADRKPVKAEFDVRVLEGVVEGVSLENVVDDPEKYAHQLVVPTDFALLGNFANPKPDGTIIGSLIAARFSLHGQNLAAHETAGSLSLVRIDPLLAKELQELKTLRMGAPWVEKLSAAKGGWCEWMTVVTLHVQERVEGEGEKWVPTLVKVEYVARMNFPALSHHNFLNSIVTLVVTPSGIQKPRPSDRNDWSKRLGVHYLSRVANMIRRMDAPSVKRYQLQMDRAINPLVR